MTSIEAFRKGRSRWLMWTAICAILACCFLVKGGTLSDLLSALLIGAANGIAVGFALGPAAHKGAIILSRALRRDAILLHRYFRFHYRSGN